MATNNPKDLFARAVLTAIACSCVSAVNVGMVIAEAGGRVSFADLLLMAAIAPWLGMATAALFVLSGPKDGA